MSDPPETSVCVKTTKLPAVKPVVCWVERDPLTKLAETLSPLVPEEPEEPDVPEEPEEPEEPAIVKHKFNEPPIWETPPVELILVTLNV